MKSLILYLLINLVNGFIDDRPLHYNEYEYNEYNYDNDYLIYDDIDNDIISFKTYCYCYYSLVILLISFICYFV
jgi:hypothetical protein